MINEFDTVRFKKDKKLYTVIDIYEDKKTGIPHYTLESQDYEDEDFLKEAEIGDIEFVSRTGNRIVDELLKDYEKRPLF